MSVPPATSVLSSVSKIVRFSSLSYPDRGQLAQPITHTTESRTLLLNTEKIDGVKNAVLQLGTVSKSPQNPLFIEDNPWEKRFDNLYGNMLYDAEEALYKCWYSPFIVANSARGMSLEERNRNPYRGRKDQEMGICYATSADGFTWQKPHLNAVLYEADRSNNLVWRGPHGAGIFKDLRETNEAHRYKMLFQQPKQGMSVSFSADGLNWSEPTLLKGVAAAGDTHNNALWAPTEEKYVAFTRTWEEINRNLKGPSSKTNHNFFRQVARMESEDFIHWTQPEVVLSSPSWERQVYAMPVFYHGGVYLGLLAVHNQVEDRVWTELAWSANSKDWHRLLPGVPFLPTSDTKLDYDYGCVYACAYPIFYRDEIRLYYGGSDYLHYRWRDGCLALATLRPDGFAGWIQEDEHALAEIRTTLFDYQGEALGVTADVESGGTLSYVVNDAQGSELSRGELRESATDKVIYQSNEPRQSQISIDFTLASAKLYSYSLI